jgi:hypothetical protein
MTFGSTFGRVFNPTFQPKSQAGDDYIANDPWTGERISFREKYGEPARWIFRIVGYKRGGA